MKETFYEKKPTRMQRMITTQRLTKRQYSPINEKKATVFKSGGQEKSSKI